MARPFISFTPHRRKRAEWLAAIFKGLGFEDALLTGVDDPQKSRKKTKENLDRADCFVAIVSPERNLAGEVLDASRPAAWVEQDVAVAVYREIPIALLWEKNMARTPMLEQMAFASEEVNFDDLEELLALTPRIISVAGKIRSFFEKSPGEDFPFISEFVHIIDQFPSLSEWVHLRTISLTALKRAESIKHGVDVGQDKAGGVSVKLADLEKDLKVTCTTDKTRFQVNLLRNIDEEVSYEIKFTPPLKPGETVVYRHESHHPAILPLTWEGLMKRAKMQGCPPFMKDGYIGNALDISRPVEKLILEIEAPLAIGLSSPQLAAYAMNSHTPMEEESNRIGNPDSKPRFWEVNEDLARGLWRCKVTIPKPRIGYTYYLLAKPTK